jgi:hypothetical protein
MKKPEPLLKTKGQIAKALGVSPNSHARRNL